MFYILTMSRKNCLKRILLDLILWFLNISVRYMVDAQKSNGGLSLTVGLIMPWDTNMGWQRSAAGASIGLDTARAAGYLQNVTIK